MVVLTTWPTILQTTSVSLQVSDSVPCLGVVRKRIRTVVTGSRGAE